MTEMKKDPNQVQTNEPKPEQPKPSAPQPWMRGTTMTGKELKMYLYQRQFNQDGVGNGTFSNTEIRDQGLYKVWPNGAITVLK